MMNLQENIRKVLKETREEKINKFITTNFDKVFDKLELIIEYERGTIYGKWFRNGDELVFHRNSYGVLWLTDCETYVKLRDYSKVIRLDLDTFNETLVNYINNKYGEQFHGKLLQVVNTQDAQHCLNK
jgi:hypothetical protein